MLLAAVVGLPGFAVAPAPAVETALAVETAPSGSASPAARPSAESTAAVTSGAERDVPRPAVCAMPCTDAGRPSAGDLRVRAARDRNTPKTSRAPPLSLV